MFFKQKFKVQKEIFHLLLNREVGDDTFLRKVEKLTPSLALSHARNLAFFNKNFKFPLSRDNYFSLKIIAFKERQSNLKTVLWKTLPSFKTDIKFDSKITHFL